MNAHQRNCQHFINQIFTRNSYESIKQLLYEWIDHNKTVPSAIDTFIKIAKTVHEQQQELIDDFNRCLIKQATLPSKTTTIETVNKLAAADKDNSIIMLDTILSWLKADVIREKALSEKLPTLNPHQSNMSHHNDQKFVDLSQAELQLRLEKHRLSEHIMKLLYIYHRGIITLREFEQLLAPVYLSDKSAFNMLFQYAQELESKRRKTTIFAPLNDLVDHKYPMSQVGPSYVAIPDSYANFSKSWKTNKLENTMNRICVSVPLGSEVSFIINRKNEYEQQLFKNEQDKYQIDSNIQCLKAAIRILQQRIKNLNSPILKRILNNIYPSENVLSIIHQHPGVAQAVVLPRLEQKLLELSRCRGKFQKQCEEIANKNFYKSLDYRCFYFRKNDKKFNCVTRWERQIQLRKEQIVHCDLTDETNQQVQDRESLQHERQCTLNSYDNITKEEFIQNRRIQLKYNRNREALYPAYPDNQILFILDFSDTELLNDVFEIILYHTQKKSILQLLVFKVFKLTIARNLYKDPNIITYIDAKTMAQPQPDEPYHPSHHPEHLNDIRRQKRVYKDIYEQFYDLVDEEVQATLIENNQSAFQGPSDHTFIATKQCYYFVRYLLTIYQRFYRAKALSERYNKDEQISLYNQFLATMIYKIKDQKAFEEYLRKIMQQDAFIFFTLDKLILGASKLINSIGIESLTYKILKENTKDYELQLRNWSDYQFDTVNEQLTRIYYKNDTFFRLTYSQTDRLLYISSWENKTPQKSNLIPNDELTDYITSYMNQPARRQRPKKISGNSMEVRLNGEYFGLEEGVMIMKGEQLYCKKDQQGSYKRAAFGYLQIRELQRQLCRLKKVKTL